MFLCRLSEVARSSVIVCLALSAFCGMSDRLVFAGELIMLPPHATADAIEWAFLHGPKTRYVKINDSTVPPSRLSGGVPPETHSHNSEEDNTSPPNRGEQSATRKPVLEDTDTTSSICPSNWEVGEAINFESNSAALTDEARDRLDEFVKAMLRDKLVKCHFIVEGHTDAHGGAAYNMLLSKHRARAVRSYLVDSGIDSSRLKIRGKGQLEPIDDDPYADENRRVQFVASGG